MTRFKIGPRKDTPKMLGENVKATMESRLTNSRVSSFSLDRSGFYLENGSLTVTIGQESPFVQDQQLTADCNDSLDNWSDESS